MSEDAAPLSAFVATIAEASDLATRWDGLCAEMMRFGFDRTLYARKPRAHADNIHNFSNVLILSSYGPVLDKMFVQNRAFRSDFTTRWSLDNVGAISWGETAARHARGALSEDEAIVHSAIVAMGLEAGITYANPPGAGDVRSGFGLCAASGIDQTEVDEIWARDGVAIEARLRIFHLSVSDARHAAPEQILSATQKATLLQVLEGHTIHEIAQSNGLHRRTVESRLETARARLGAVNTLQAVLKAREQGQI